MKKKIQAACAIISDSKSLLVGKRTCALWKGKWELIGGKIDGNETPTEAIVRELKEELNCDATVIGNLEPYQHEYPDFHLTLYPMICEIHDRSVLESKDHSELKWIPLSDIMSYDFLEADYHAIRQFADLNFN
jgi:8-oxo-dGTP diphosphatase